MCPLKAAENPNSSANSSTYVCICMHTQFFPAYGYAGTEFGVCQWCRSMAHPCWVSLLLAYTSIPAEGLTAPSASLPTSKGSLCPVLPVWGQQGPYPHPLCNAPGNALISPLPCTVYPAPFIPHQSSLTSPLRSGLKPIYTLNLCLSFLCLFDLPINLACSLHHTQPHITITTLSIRAVRISSWGRVW